MSLYNTFSCLFSKGLSRSKKCLSKPRARARVCGNDAGYLPGGWWNTVFSHCFNLSTKCTSHLDGNYYSIIKHWKRSDKPVLHRCFIDITRWIGTRAKWRAVNSSFWKLYVFHSGSCTPRCERTEGGQSHTNMTTNLLYPVVRFPVSRPLIFRSYANLFFTFLCN